MITLSPLRWGKPYKSLEFQDVIHFETGESIAKDWSGKRRHGSDGHAQGRQREYLRCVRFRPHELLKRIGKAADLFETGTLGSRRWATVCR